MQKKTRAQEVLEGANKAAGEKAIDEDFAAAEIIIKAEWQRRVAKAKFDIARGGGGLDDPVDKKEWQGKGRSSKAAAEDIC